MNRTLKPTETILLKLNHEKLLSSFAFNCHLRRYIVERLLAAGADVNKAGTSNRSTPLYIAAQRGHVLGMCRWNR